MDAKSIMEDEKRMERENALSVVKKLFTGSLVILTVGFAAFMLLFVFMFIM